jgi:hypothetical protein
MEHSYEGRITTEVERIFKEIMKDPGKMFEMLMEANSRSAPFGKSNLPAINMFTQNT